MPAIPQRQVTIPERMLGQLSAIVSLWRFHYRESSRHKLDN